MNIEHHLSTKLLGDTSVKIFESWPENYGLLFTLQPLGRVPLVRIQSRCTYGDVFGSHHCDCGEQLSTSARELRKRGGLLFYLEQEGRGAGPIVKADAYAAEERTGIDTFSYYEKLGLEADSRDYAPVARALLELGVERIRLLTNNPLKVTGLARSGIEVVREPLVVKNEVAATRYIQAKRSRGHHL